MKETSQCEELHIGQNVSMKTNEKIAIYIQVTDNIIHDSLINTSIHKTFLEHLIDYFFLATTCEAMSVVYPPK